jgi:hypothetical protein
MFFLLGMLTCMLQKKFMTNIETCKYILIKFLLMHKHLRINFLMFVVLNIKFNIQRNDGETEGLKNKGHIEIGWRLNVHL